MQKNSCLWILHQVTVVLNTWFHFQSMRACNCKTLTQWLQRAHVHCILWLRRPRELCKTSFFLPSFAFYWFQSLYYRGNMRVSRVAISKSCECKMSTVTGGGSMLILGPLRVWFSDFRLAHALFDLSRSTVSCDTCLVSHESSVCRLGVACGIPINSGSVESFSSSS